MSRDEVGEYEAEDIRKIVGRILQDLGNPEPPLKLSQVRALLELNIGYYSTANTTLLQDVGQPAGRTSQRQRFPKRGRRITLVHPQAPN